MHHRRQPSSSPAGGQKICGAEDRAAALEDGTGGGHLLENGHTAGKKRGNKNNLKATMAFSCLYTKLKMDHFWRSFSGFFFLPALICFWVLAKEVKTAAALVHYGAWFQIAAAGTVHSLFLREDEEISNTVTWNMGSASNR